MEDLLQEKEVCEKDSDIESDDDENPADVVLGGMPLRMTSGRTVICPKRLDLLFVFRRPLANACIADNEWSIMPFLLSCYSYCMACPRFTLTSCSAYRIQRHDLLPILLVFIT